MSIMLSMSVSMSNYLCQCPGIYVPVSHNEYLMSVSICPGIAILLSMSVSVKHSMPSIFVRGNNSIYVSRYLSACSMSHLCRYLLYVPGIFYVVSMSVYIEITNQCICNVGGRYLCVRNLSVIHLSVSQQCQYL
jgi:hypothetical protein